MSILNTKTQFKSTKISVLYINCVDNLNTFQFLFSSITQKSLYNKLVVIRKSFQNNCDLLCTLSVLVNVEMFECRWYVCVMSNDFFKLKG